MAKRRAIITIANQKGGVGKTTTAVTLAHGLAIKGRETLLFDLDPQGQCASALGIDQESGVFNLLTAGLKLAAVTRPTDRAHLSIIPGDKRTATAQTVLVAEGFDLSVIKSLLHIPMRNGLEYAIIDTAPSVGGLQEAALFAADYVIIPTATDYLATEGVVRIMETLNVLVGRGWKGVVLGILPTFHDDVTRESQATLTDLQKAFGANMILSPIHRATVLRECASQGKTIWEIAPTSRPAQEYANVVWRLNDAATT